MRLPSRSHPFIAAALLIAGAVWAVSTAIGSLGGGALTPPVTLSSPISAGAAPVTNRVDYIAVQDSCGPSYEGTCVVARSGPGLSYPVALRLRSGMVLRVDGTTEADGRTWYRIVFDEWLRYPERAGSALYVAGDLVEPFTDQGPQDLSDAEATGIKRIIVDRSDQMLYAYDGDMLFMQSPVSTGLELTPTPRGTFTIYRKTPSRYMQGPIPGISAQDYDLPGVPWNLYFTQEGAVIHGAYWHDDFGKTHSNGCVNLPIDAAKKLYEWADLGTEVTVRD